MLTRRDLFMALAAAGSVFNLRAFARSGAEVMGSSTFEWASIPVQPTKIGSTRKFFQAPTATLDELECHVTTLNPGEIPHPPHKHPDEEVVIIREGTVEFYMNGETRAGRVRVRWSFRPRTSCTAARTWATFPRHIT